MSSKLMFSPKTTVLLFLTTVVTADRTDGQPNVADQELFNALYSKVEEDRDMTEQRGELINYAKKAVEDAKKQGFAGLDWLKNNSPLYKDAELPFDLLMYGGNGRFNGIGHGGVLAVLDELNLIGKRMASEGSVASAVLASAGLDEFLKAHQVWQLYYEGWFLDSWTKNLVGGPWSVRGLASSTNRWAQEAGRDTTLTSAIYLKAVEKEEVFEAVRKDVTIVAACGVGGVVSAQSGRGEGNVGFRGFKTREQLAAVAYASGNTSVSGYVGYIGTKIPDADYYCGGGGSVDSLFPTLWSDPQPSTEKPVWSQTLLSAPRPLLRYEPPRVNKNRPTKDSIDTLFRDGVRDILALLQSTPIQQQETAQWVWKTENAAVFLDRVLIADQKRSGDEASRFKTALGKNLLPLKDVDLVKEEL